MKKVYLKVSGSENDVLKFAIDYTKEINDANSFSLFPVAYDNRKVILETSHNSVGQFVIRDWSNAWSEQFNEKMIKVYKTLSKELSLTIHIYCYDYDTKNETLYYFSNGLYLHPTTAPCLRLTTSYTANYAPLYDDTKHRGFITYNETIRLNHDKIIEFLNSYLTPSLHGEFANAKINTVESLMEFIKNNYFYEDRTAIVLSKLNNLKYYNFALNNEIILGGRLEEEFKEMSFDEDRNVNIEDMTLKDDIKGEIYFYDIDRNVTLKDNSKGKTSFFGK